MNMSSKSIIPLLCCLNFITKLASCKLPFVHQFDERSYKGDILNLPPLLSIAQAGKYAAGGGRHWRAGIRRRGQRRLPRARLGRWGGGRRRRWRRLWQRRHRKIGNAHGQSAVVMTGVFFLLLLEWCFLLKAHRLSHTSLVRRRGFHSHGGGDVRRWHGFQKQSLQFPRAAPDAASAIRPLPSSQGE